jgi:hypothetical protein
MIGIIYLVKFNTYLKWGSFCLKRSKFKCGDEVLVIKSNSEIDDIVESTGLSFIITKIFIGKDAYSNDHVELSNGWFYNFNEIVHATEASKVLYAKKV